MSHWEINEKLSFILPPSELHLTHRGASKLHTSAQQWPQIVIEQKGESAVNWGIP